MACLDFLAYLFAEGQAIRREEEVLKDEPAPRVPSWLDELEEKQRQEPEEDLFPLDRVRLKSGRRRHGGDLTDVMREIEAEKRWTQEKGFPA